MVTEKTESKDFCSFIKNTLKLILGPISGACDLQFEIHSMLFSLSCDHSDNIVEKKSFFSMLRTVFFLALLRSYIPKLKGDVVLVCLYSLKFIVVHAKCIVA